METKRQLKYKSYSVIITTVLLSNLLLDGAVAKASDGDIEAADCGYVEVRRNAYMFWMKYKSPYRHLYPGKVWPTLLWLQGGPGSSGIGLGNFLEIGPLDATLSPRNLTWLRVADLLFVDNPVGTGFSYVKDKKLLVRTDEAAASDLTTLLENLSCSHSSFHNSPLYIVAESYGGKFAATLALSILKATDSLRLKIKLGGVALGNSWISPFDFVSTWGPLLKDLSRLDAHAEEISNRLVVKIENEMGQGHYVNATDSWEELKDWVHISSHGVNMYNFLLDSDERSLSSRGDSTTVLKKRARHKYASRLTSAVYPGGRVPNMNKLMNTVIRNKLKIIPESVTWEGQKDAVFEAMEGDFMKPRIQEVDLLLERGVDVTIYSGQVDVMCCTKGTSAWMEKLRWDGLEAFMNSTRTPLLTEKGGEGGRRLTGGFTKFYRNLRMYWILRSGHFVPAEAPRISLRMAAAITRSPAKTHIHF